MTVFHPDAILERREEMVGKPLLTGSALSSDNLQDICDVEAVPPEADVLIKNTFSIIHIAKIPISKVLNRQRSGQYMVMARRVESSPATDSNHQVDYFKPTRACRVKLFNCQRTTGAFSLLGTVTDIAVRGCRREASCFRYTVTCCTWLMSTILLKKPSTMFFYVWCIKKILL